MWAFFVPGAHACAHQEGTQWLFLECLWAFLLATQDCTSLILTALDHGANIDLAMSIYDSMLLSKRRQRMGLGSVSLGMGSGASPISQGGNTPFVWPAATLQVRVCHAFKSCATTCKFISARGSRV